MISFPPLRLAPAALLVVTLGHTEAITDLAYLPDGRSLVTASDDHTARLWDRATGRVTRVFAGAIHGLNGVALLSDGRQLAAASDDGRVHLWDVARATLLQSFGTRPTTECVAAASDGRLASSHWSRVRVWEPQKGAMLREIVVPFASKQEYVTSLAFSPEGGLLLVGGHDGSLRLYGAGSGAEVRRFAGHAKVVARAVFVPGSRRVLSASHDGTLRLWDADTGEALRTFTGHTRGVLALAVSPDGRRAASGAVDRTVRVWDVETGTELHRLEARGWDVQGLAFSPDGRELAASVGRHLMVWDPRSGALLARLESRGAALRDLALSRDGRVALVAREDAPPQAWDLESGRLTRTWPAETAKTAAVALSKDGRLAALGSREGTVEVWGASGGSAPVSTARVGDSRITALAFSPDSTRLAAGDTRNSWALLDARSGEVVRSGQAPQVVHYQVTVTAVAFSTDGRALDVVSGGNVRVRLDAATGRELSRAPTIASVSRAGAAVSGDGRRLIVEDKGIGAFALLDAETGAVLLQVQAHDRSMGHLQALAFSPDGKKAASGARSGEIRVWDLASGRMERELLGHTGEVSACAFLPDGRRLVSASRDGTLRVWTLRDGSSRVLASED